MQANYYCDVTENIPDSCLHYILRHVVRNLKIALVVPLISLNVPGKRVRNHIYVANAAVTSSGLIRKT